MSLRQDALFEQLPFEINVLIINKLDSSMLIGTSVACKRWLNNTKCVTDLDIYLTYNVPIPIDTGQITKVPVMVRPPVDKDAVKCTLDKFSSDNIRSLVLQPAAEELSAIVRSFISNLKHLESLSISSVFLSPYWPTRLPLKELHFVGTIQNMDHLTQCLVGFTNLEKLSLEFGNSIQHSYDFEVTRFGALKNCTWLKILKLNCKKMRLDYLGGMTQLKQLYLHYAYFDDDKFVNLSKLTNLESLSLAGLKADTPPDEAMHYMSFEIPPAIGNMNPISGLRHLTSLCNLTSLDISDVRQVMGDDFVESSCEYDVAELVKQHFTKLKTINLTGTPIGAENEAKLREIKGLTVETRKWTI